LPIIPRKVDLSQITWSFEANRVLTREKELKYGTILIFRIRLAFNLTDS